MHNFKPIIADSYFFMVGFDGVDNKVYKDAYKIPVVDVTRSSDKTSNTPSKWITMTPVDHLYTTLIHCLSPPVVVGGHHHKVIATTSHIKMHDESSNSWRKIALLSSARSGVAIAAVNDNAIIVIGGFHRRGEDAIASSLTTVELGQPYLKQLH